MSFAIIAVGRMRQGPEQVLFTRYAARIRPKLTLREIPDALGNVVEIKRREGEAILAALATNQAVIALDPNGTMLSSEALAARIDRALESQGGAAFCIGGAEGLSDQVLGRADFSLSFGPMIWPHMLARVMIAEQIFRARSISAGHPYHRAGKR